MVLINIPDEGKIELFENSSLMILKGKEGDNRVSLVHGSINADINIDKPGFTVITRAAELQNKGGSFSVTIGEGEVVTLQLDNAFVDIIAAGKKLTVIHDYNCEILPNGIMGIPYHNDASLELKDALNKISFANGGREYIQTVIQEVSEFDAITLWHLLWKMNTRDDRLIVFNKLNQLYPIPPGVTENGILSLDTEMMEIWHTDIEWQI